MQTHNTIINRIKNLGIGGKLLSIFLGCSLLFIIILTSISYFSGSSAIENEAVAKLSAVAELKTQTIQNFFNDRFGEIHVMTGIDIIKTTSDNLLKDIQGSTISPDLSLEKKREFLNKTSANYRLLHQYIDKYKFALENFAEIKLVPVFDVRNALGQVVFHEGDQIISTNDFSGNVSDRSMYRGGYDLMVKGAGGVESDKYNCPLLYTSSIEHCSELNKASIHMSHGLGRHGLTADELKKSTPVKDRFTFMMIYDINVNAINHLCQDKTGLGDTGETYLAERLGMDDGADRKGNILMLTDSRFEKDTALKRDLSNIKALQDLFNRMEHRRGSEYCQNLIYNDYRDIPVLGHNHLLKIGIHEIAIITEIDRQEVFDAAGNLLIIMLTLGFFLIVLAVIISIVFSRSISRPLNYAVDFAGIIASGDLTAEMDQNFLDRGDEIGGLAKALKKMVDDLKTIISNVILSAQNLSQAVQEIASGNETLSQRTAEQASALEEIASTIEESTATIKQNTENTRNANTLSSESLKRAEEGGRIVDQSVNAIIEINDSSKRIGEIIGVINEIAFQTNLLALNASVEAARAGEMGRGFAVVAGEVRNLAQRSANAAKEIESLIKDSIEKIKKGTDLSRKSGSALEEIIDRMQTVNKTINEIAAASEEQRSGIEQINTAVIEMDSMTQQNASLVEETASAGEEMANQAQELIALVERFKIDKDIQKKQIDYHREIKQGPATGKMTHTIRNKPTLSGTAAGKKGANELKDILSEEGFKEF
ncbi:MAG: hypothetical protein CVV44_07560 [Spirochaetae bacterium HGW-Spirochaetae-1]|jgi:methyl-accepting chemotaxis protein|nr:MAG: hypothetical protein CVV44_07560 [Spirochaetae bacterium HGW-Spirochaetae-1]